MRWIGGRRLFKKRETAADNLCDDTMKTAADVVSAKPEDVGMEMQRMSIVSMFHEKAALYRELLAVLKEERDLIVRADVEALWRTAEKKQAAAARIEAVRGGILASLSEVGISHDMGAKTFSASRIVALLPGAQAREVTALLHALSILKEEVRTVAGENKRYIELCLGIFDDLMAVLTGTDTGSGGYHADRRGMVCCGPRLLHREV